ncbi:MAG: Lipopolysaccharide export system ATP-binding protein LptB [Candidatus Dichloromethanomonas elyunquensis]|nr:MAG: Lipopolysaccharide export system ATP-binding protein LptB [Candidatus Dichloromethanomonas elyunquensis]
MLSVRGIHKAYGGLQVLTNVNIEAPTDRITGLIGPNGAGKTTLFNVITGFVKPDSGSFSFNGRDLTGVAPEKVCVYGIARTFQLVKTFNNLTVEKNVAIGALSREKTIAQAHSKAREILNFLGMNHKRAALARNLTLSDRKRLEVARALATNPKMLLLDEVMCGLNPTEINGMMEVIRAIHRTGVGILLIEHIMSAVMSLSDHIIVLNNGQKLTEGNAEKVSHDPAVIVAYLGEEYARAYN